MINANTRWIGVTGAALAGALFLPTGIAVAAEPDLASCKQVKLSCVEHGPVIRVFISGDKTPQGDLNEDDADPAGGAGATPARLDCSTEIVRGANATRGDSEMVSLFVTLLASDADDAENDDSDG